MVEERRDFQAVSNLSTEKKEREDALREAGLRHRENAARNIIGERVTEIEGRPQRLSDEVTVEVNDDSEIHQNGQGKRRRRNPRHQQAVEQMLNEEMTNSSDLETRRLELEAHRLAKEFEIQEKHLGLQRQDLELGREERQQSFRLEQQKLVRKQENFQNEMREQLKAIGVAVSSKKSMSSNSKYWRRCYVAIKVKQTQ
ncbi:hypothetical protein PC116_g13208 [Phytophthora cactorum]|uniref:Uncharacterized protein n=1 Tax=Phytophthora cactorum TaxID=29920 RepID=A0A8T1CG75_9STRA|nr:hypothetical protein PC111_g7736 [Phytophthora cactorum]KAG2858191.1 hypothetical protein PC113_g10023 [Phytophthora cactorum]KAG2905425.1 hypothetical protein PC114_g11536 [Phytophthora cactorum]KAG2920602.1 hypothetical protein PC115_g9757 [Phytophthora cactorum]KAG2938366.1 hypothetical protein PC117_g11267 [Phytophthora cactorum]